MEMNEFKVGYATMTQVFAGWAKIERQSDSIPSRVFEYHLFLGFGEIVCASNSNRVEYIRERKKEYSKDNNATLSSHLGKFVIFSPIVVSFHSDNTVGGGVGQTNSSEMPVI